MKKAAKAKVVRMTIQTRIYSRKLPESIQNAISFDVIQFKHFKLFMEKPSLVIILCFRQWHVFQKWGVSQRSKGRGHEKFSRGQAPGPPFLLPSLAPRYSPPNINFVATGLHIILCEAIQGSPTKFAKEPERYRRRRNINVEKELALTCP